MAKRKLRKKNAAILAGILTLICIAAALILLKKPLSGKTDVPEDSGIDPTEVFDDDVVVPDTSKDQQNDSSGKKEDGIEAGETEMLQPESNDPEPVAGEPATSDDTQQNPIDSGSEETVNPESDEPQGSEPTEPGGSLEDQPVSVPDKDPNEGELDP